MYVILGLIYLSIALYAKKIHMIWDTNSQDYPGFISLAAWLWPISLIFIILRSIINDFKRILTLKDVN